jgi:hypothetical protein
VLIFVRTKHNKYAMFLKKAISTVEQKIMLGKIAGFDPLESAILAVGLELLQNEIEEIADARVQEQGRSSSKGGDSERS